MSETVEHIVETPKEPVTTADLQSLLDARDKRVQELEQERDRERTARIAAERDREESSGQALTEAERRYAAEVQAAKGAAAASQAEIDRAKSRYKLALEAGNWDEATEAQELLADATGRRREAKGREEWLERNKDTYARPAPRETQQRQSKYNMQLVDGEAEWLDKRPQFLTDQRYKAKVLSASGLAAADHTRGSKAYFDAMERYLGEAEEEAPPVPRETTRRAPSADLPAAGRRAPGQAPQGGREISLTADQREIADMMWGNPATDGYIEDLGERYKKYANMQAKVAHRL